jgi:hypothetical protein
MLKNEGKRYVDQLFKDKQLVVKTSDRVEEMISWYENALLSM